MRPEISVIICTHNPRKDYLARTVGALHGQGLPRERWEFILIDNASSPERLPDCDLSWHPEARVVREDMLGLTPARLRGIREARGGLLVFVDDDNVLDPDYLEQALNVAEDKPFLGSWSGQCRPCFEQPPPAWSVRYWRCLTILEFTADAWSNLPFLPGTNPSGAGLCVREAVARRYAQMHDAGLRPVELDRAGSSLLSGGDLDLAACACDLGMGVGLIAALKLTHLIPPERLSVKYLARLVEGIHFSLVMVDAARGGRVGGPGKLRRFLQAGRALCSAPPHGTILRAAHRGRDQALRAVSGKAAYVPRP